MLMYNLREETVTTALSCLILSCLVRDVAQKTINQAYNFS